MSYADDTLEKAKDSLQDAEDNLRQFLSYAKNQYGQDYLEKVENLWIDLRKMIRKLEE